MFKLSQVSPESSGGNEMVDVLRYTMTEEIRYRGSRKIYIYESKEYGVSITPSNVGNPVKRYDPELFEGMANERVVVKVKKWLLLACVQLLQVKEVIENEIQKQLAVN